MEVSIMECVGRRAAREYWSKGGIDDAAFAMEGLPLMDAGQANKVFHVLQSNEGSGAAIFAFAIY
jgi:hypothetical protein